MPRGRATDTSLRERVVLNVLVRHCSVHDVATLLDVPDTTVYNILRHFIRHGACEPLAHGRGPARAYSNEDLAEEPTATRTWPNYDALRRATTTCTCASWRSSSARRKASM